MNEEHDSLLNEDDLFAHCPKCGMPLTACQCSEAAATCFLVLVTLGALFVAYIIWRR